MKAYTIKALHENMDALEQQEVTVEGWIRNSRAQKAFGFIDLNDGSKLSGVQIVYEKDTVDNFDAIAKVHIGAALRVNGTLIKTPSMKQPFEIKASTVEIVGPSRADYPIQPKRHSREFLRENAHLRARTNLFTAVFRVRSILTHAIHRFFQERDFMHVASPIITASDAEGAGELFKVTTLDLTEVPKDKDKTVDFRKDFFGKKANLTVSGQLQAEIFAQAFKNVYTFGPTFRAEKSHTATHASEFWMIEPEIAFADLNTDMDLAESMVKYLIDTVLKEASEEIQFFDRFVSKGLVKKLKNVVEKPFVRITHKKAVDILKAAKQDFENTPDYQDDFAKEHEKYLVSHFDAPVFVTDWPKDIKAFYMRLNDDGQTVAAMDLLVPGAGEMIGGSQREERLDVLKQRMEAMGIPEEELWWYLDLRMYGSTPHAGFGLGFDRMLMYVTGVENIRDVIPFPRTPKQCEF